MIVRLQRRRRGSLTGGWLRRPEGIVLGEVAPLDQFTPETASHGRMGQHNRRHGAVPIDPSVLNVYFAESAHTNTVRRIARR